MYKAFLSLRYLRTRYIALASIVSVMLGVATMVVVNSVMRGFTSEMRDRIKGILADIVIETTSLDGQESARLHFERVRRVAGDKIAGMTATVEVWGLVSFPFGDQWTTRAITLIGIEPESKATVGPLVQYLESYHPLREGDKVVRGPLRRRDEPPGWELTGEAKAFRVRQVERRKWLAERMAKPRDLSVEPPAPPSNVITAGHSTAAPKAADAHGKAAPPAGDKPAAPKPELDPFDGQAPAVPDPREAGEAPIDETAPLKARIYLGAGLCRASAEDPVTHKIRTIPLVQPGQDVKISTVTSGRPPERVSFDATVVDIFKCGMSEYDSTLVFVNREELQRVRGMVDLANPADPEHQAITSIQIKLKDFADAPEVIKRLEGEFPAGLYTIKTWEQKQGPLLAAVEIETGILNVLLFLIIAVAGFGILAIFFMIVVEKTRDIGVLKALGASSGGVMSIFLSYGLALGLVGSGVGVALGLVFVRYINEIESAIAAVTGRKIFDDKIYYFPSIPTLVEPGTVVWVTLGAVAIAVLASVLPARRAARLRPVEALRYE